ncbi:MAG: hypothetical protein JXA20_07355 [Spirochaetes bacterium]|nr:hypothetical protein [Spirochaetota bacterium]
MESFYNVGDEVLAFWERAKAHFIATVVEIEQAQDGSRYRVVFADNDSAVLDSASLVPLNLQPGAKVAAKWNDGRFYPGTIANKAGNAYFIEFEDGDKGWVAASGIAVK